MASMQINCLITNVTEIERAVARPYAKIRP
jgi:hypothetical protein